MYIHNIKSRKMDSLGRQAVITTHTVLPGRHRLWEEKLSAGEEGRADNFHKKKKKKNPVSSIFPLPIISFSPPMLIFFFPWIFISRFKFDRAIASLKFRTSIGGLTLCWFYSHLFKGVPLWFSLITLKIITNKSIFSLKY